MLSRYQHLDGPLYDLIGKLTDHPCWQLIGDSVRDRAEVTHSHDFSLPDSWVDGSEVTLEAVVDPEMAIEEADMPPMTAPNNVARSFTLSRTRGLRVRYLDVCFKVLGEEIRCPSGNTGAVGGFTRKVYPVEPGSFSYQPLRVPRPIWVTDLAGLTVVDKALRRALFQAFINRYFTLAVAGNGGLIDFDLLAIWIPAGVAGRTLVLTCKSKAFNCKMSVWQDQQR